MSKFHLTKKFHQHFLCLFLIFLFLSFFSPSLEGAYLRNFPVKISQPNGEILNVFVSGDEFYNWIHDKNGYTIIRNPKTGYYVYAVKEEGDLLPSPYMVSSSHVVNLLSLYSLNIPKYLQHSQEKRKSPQELFPVGSGADIDSLYPAPKTGTINNLCIFIRFSDESEFTDATSIYQNMLNDNTAGANSMLNYFKEVSYNALTVSTTFYPTATTTVLSYQDTQVRAYYQPYDESTNPSGYPPEDEEEREEREHTLLKNAVNAISSQVPPGLNVDGDNNGYVDNVVFIVSGEPDGWSSLLWPHKWQLHSFTVDINSKRVWTYNFQLQTSLGSSGVGVLCHEMFHSIGAPDLYHYDPDYSHLEPVSKWDLMEWDLNPPQHMGAYMKYRYGTWISSIPAITTSGTYTLNPVSSSTNNCYKIASPFTSDEYFMVEYRNNSGTFESSLPGSGLLVYRINNTLDGQGNSQGPPDEVYIYRPGGTTALNGTIDSANFNSGVERISINYSTDPTSFLTSGAPGGLNISNIGAVNGTISFDVNFPTVSISGNVKESGGTGVEGVTILFSNGGGQASTNSSGDYSHTIGTGWAGTATPSKTGTAFTPTSRTYSTITTNQTNQDYTVGTPPQISLSRSRLNFGSVIGEGTTGSQSFLVSNSSVGTLNWSASDDKDWLTFTPSSGANSGVVTVSVNPTGLSEGSYTGTVTVTDPYASNSPQTLSVYFNVKEDGNSPFGSFDTPTNGTTGVTGSIPVTGWAIDDVEVQSVKIYRDPVAGESTEDPIYIGDALPVEGARPDVEQAYSGYPYNYQAGWGYMMLTNFLPNQGNGSYKLYAIATDIEGHQVTLGTKTITCDNANAVKPFGAIDTPTQGGIASGKFFIAGWALTPMPNTIPVDGSTINVWVDGVPIGHPTYNQFRNDIASLFPNYNNTSGAVGALFFDTTPYTNGVHTLAWSVRDDAENSDGIGSRFFTITNAGGSAAAQTKIQRLKMEEETSVSFKSILNFPMNFQSIKYKKGYRKDIETRGAELDKNGLAVIEIKEVERIEVYLGAAVSSGYMVVGEELRPLPIGSTLDVKKGKFLWQPGPGFIGDYNLVFIVKDKNSVKNKLLLKISIVPKFISR